jgi:iron complex transport system substrate-binding protein
VRHPVRSALFAFALAASIAARPTVEKPRVVTLSPSLTAILLALHADDAIVGVDDSSAQAEPRVRDLPRVGGLFNPSLEAIVALRPTAVALVPSAQQRELRDRLEALGIEVLALQNIRFPDVLGSIGTLGSYVGRNADAVARVGAIEKAFGDSQARASRAPRVRAVLVLQREPLYVVGQGSFLDTMLAAAGAENLARAFDEPYPRVSVEWLIAAAPDLILDAADPADGAAAHWAHWPSLPAVKHGRVRTLDRAVTIPGPYLDRSLVALSEQVRAPETAP